MYKRKISEGDIRKSSSFSSTLSPYDVESEVSSPTWNPSLVVNFNDMSYESSLSDITSEESSDENESRDDVPKYRRHHRERNGCAKGIVIARTINGMPLVKSGTVIRLLWHLICLFDDSLSDAKREVWSDFVQDFLVLHDWFIDSITLLDMTFGFLEEPLDVTAIDGVGDIKSRERLSFCISGFLQHWISKYYLHQWRGQGAILSCLLTHLKSNSLTLHQIDNVREVVTNAQQQPPRDQVIEKPSSDRIGHRISFLEIPAEVTANQLTVIEYQRFIYIDPCELKEMAWTSNSKNDDAPNVCSLIRHFNSVSFWVVGMILNSKYPSMRAKVFSHFVKIASCLRALGNYNAMTAIFSGLTHSAITRLKETHRELSSNTVKDFDTLKAFMTPAGNWKNYRLSLSAHFSNDDFCIPYIGLLLQDLVFLHDGNPNWLDEDKTVLNFYKISLQANVILAIRLLQRKRLPVIPHAGMIAIMRVFLHPQLAEDDLYELSLAREQRKHRSGSLGTEDAPPESPSRRNSTPDPPSRALSLNSDESVVLTRSRSNSRSGITGLILQMGKRASGDQSSWNSLNGSTNSNLNGDDVSAGNNAGTDVILADDTSNSNNKKDKAKEPASVGLFKRARAATRIKVSSQLVVPPPTNELPSAAVKLSKTDVNDSEEKVFLKDERAVTNRLRSFSLIFNREKFSSCNRLSEAQDKDIVMMVDTLFHHFDADKTDRLNASEFREISSNFPFMDSFQTVDIHGRGFISREDMLIYFKSVNNPTLRRVLGPAIEFYVRVSETGKWSTVVLAKPPMTIVNMLSGTLKKKNLNASEILIHAINTHKAAEGVGDSKVVDPSADVSVIRNQHLVIQRLPRSSAPDISLFCLETMRFLREEAVALKHRLETETGALLFVPADTDVLGQVSDIHVANKEALERLNCRLELLEKKLDGVGQKL